MRIMLVGRESYFVNKDVTDILGYTNPSKVIAGHVDDKDKLNNGMLLI